MPKLFAYVVLTVFCSCNVVAQKSDKLVLHSLEFLNQRFHLNLEKENVVIMVKLNNLERYICYKYFKNNYLPELSRITWEYEINQVSKNSYKFTLTGSSKFKGTFDAIEKEQNFTFTNLKYIKRND